MPTYEYKCLECGHRFEAFQMMSDAPLTMCAQCKGAVKRLIGSGAGIIFKGSGFYCTDYKASSAPGSSDSASSANSDSKADSATASTADKTATKSDSGSSTATKTTDSKAVTASSKP